MPGSSPKNQEREQAQRDGKMKSQKEKETMTFSEELLKLEKLFLKMRFCLKMLLKSKLSYKLELKLPQEVQEELLESARNSKLLMTTIQKLLTRKNSKKP